jgi:hypothetical protein
MRMYSASQLPLFKITIKFVWLIYEIIWAHKSNSNFEKNDKINKGIISQILESVYFSSLIY